MSIETVRQVVARAVTEPDFRALLRAAPGLALASLELTEEETEALATVEPTAFDGWLSALETRASRAVGVPPSVPINIGGGAQPSGF
jgi:hypothetical protein